MSEEHGIENFNKVMDGLEDLGVAGAKIFEDGKISAADLPEFIALATKFGSLIDAFKAFKPMIKEDVKDIDAEEALLMLKKFYEVAKAIEEAA